MDFLHAARDTIMQEAQALHALADSLGQSFLDAMAIFTQTRSKQGGQSGGRLVITGMGKSGHIARKIAATLASTGTPAYFVHPAEASHGDLGMITEGDAILALSNSGETRELADIIAYSQRFSIPLVAITGKATSSLAEAANVALILPAIAEASPIGAPTTSTTMSLALGDAIAMALLQESGFNKEDFATFHPGGKLGKQLLRARDIMHEAAELPLANSDDSMQDVLLTMTQKHFGCAGVVDDAGALIGIVTDGDLRRHMAADILDKTARDIMTPSPLSIQPTTLAAQALALMNDKTVTSLFVVDNTKPVGILHIHDCLRAGIT